MKVKRWQIEDTDVVKNNEIKIDHNDLTDIGPNDHHDKFTIEDHANVDHSGLPGIGVSKQAILVTRPVVDILDEPYLGATIRLQASNSFSAFSGYGTSIIYRWYIDDEYQDDGTIFQLQLDSSKFSTGQNINIKCKAVDSLGNESYWTIKTITIKQGSKPVIDSYLWDNELFIVNTTRTLTVVAHDSTSSTLEYSLVPIDEFSKQCIINKNLTNRFKVTFANINNSNYTATFKILVTNKNGGFVEQNIVCNVIYDPPPIIRQVWSWKWISWERQITTSGVPLFSGGVSSILYVKAYDPNNSPLTIKAYSSDPTHLIVEPRQYSGQFYIKARGLDYDTNRKIHIVVSDQYSSTTYDYNVPIKGSAKITSFYQNVNSLEFHNRIQNYTKVFHFHFKYDRESLGIKQIIAEVTRFSYRSRNNYIRYLNPVYKNFAIIKNVVDLEKNNFETYISYYPHWKYEYSQRTLCNYLSIDILLKFKDYNDKIIKTANVNIVSDGELFMPYDELYIVNGAILH